MFTTLEYTALAATADARGAQHEVDRIIDMVSNGVYSGLAYSIEEIGVNYTVFIRRRDLRTNIVLRGKKGAYLVIPDGFLAYILLRVVPRSGVIFDAIRRYRALGQDVVVTGRFVGGRLANFYRVERGLVVIDFRAGSVSCTLCGPLVLDTNTKIGLLRGF